MLWLLHGGFGSSADWTTVGDAEALTAGLPMIVVMPDAGIGGWYTDWKRGTPEGPQRWETFHLDELRPFIEARYQTRTDRGGRADRRPVDGRVRRDELRGASSRPVRVRGVVLRRGRPAASGRHRRS